MKKVLQIVMPVLVVSTFIAQAAMATEHYVTSAETGRHLASVASMPDEESVSKVDDENVSDQQQTDHYGFAPKTHFR